MIKINVGIFFCEVVPILPVVVGMLPHCQQGTQITVCSAWLFLELLIVSSLQSDK